MKSIKSITAGTTPYCNTSGVNEIGELNSRGINDSIQ